MAWEFLYSETTIDNLPHDLKAQIKLVLSTREEVLFCLLAGHKKNPNVLIITDFNLIFTCGDGLRIRLPSEQAVMSVYVIPLEKVKNILHTERVHKPILGSPAYTATEVEIDYGVLSYVDSQPDPVRMSFLHSDGSLAEKFWQILTKAAAESLVRMRAPVSLPSAHDIGDQLTKLVALRDKGDLTQAEFETAKRKLLS